MMTLVGELFYEGPKHTGNWSPGHNLSIAVRQEASICAKPMKYKGYSSMDKVLGRLDELEGCEEPECGDDGSDGSCRFLKNF